MNLTLRWTCLIVWAICVSAPPACCEEPAWGSNLHPAFVKLGRGVSNIAGGWLEIPLNLDQRYAPQDTGASIVTGAIVGVVRAVVRTGVGAYETATFLLPIPRRYAPILPTLEYFKKSEWRKPLLLE